MLFSVVIPVYNRDELLRRTLLSVAGQTYRPLQIIIVDNNSTDNSVLVADNFKKEYEAEDISIDIVQECEPGTCVARNRGLEQVEGEYVYFFDSDDEMTRSFFSDVYSAISQTSPKPDYIAVNTRIVAGNRTHPRVFIKNASITDHILTGTLATQSMVLLTSFVRRIGGWNKSVERWNDWELGTRVLRYAKLSLWMEGVYHKVYSHSESISGRSFGTDYLTLLNACNAVKHDVMVAPPYEYTNLALKALGFRLTILAAHIRKEGLYAQSNEIRRQGRVLQKSKRALFIAQILYYYTSFGGRGGWRIARLFLKFALSKK